MTHNIVHALRSDKLMHILVSVQLICHGSEERGAVLVHILDHVSLPQHVPLKPHVPLSQLVLLCQVRLGPGTIGIHRIHRYLKKLCQCHYGDIISMLNMVICVMNVAQKKKK